MKTKGKLSLTVIFLILFLGAIIALESLNNYVSGADVGTLALTLSTAPNNITLISPEDGRTISEEATLMFEYMPSSALNIASCTLILNGTLTQTNSSAIVVEATLNFSRLMHFGTYNWGVSCTSTTDIQFNSSTRLLTVASTAIAPAPIRTGNQPPNPVTEIVSTVFIGDVTANEAKIITDIDERTGVARIAIKTTKYIQNAKATIKLLYDKPADVETPNGFSYKYISIGIPALTEDTLSEAEIEFFVDKQWMVSNDISTKSVHLARYQQATGWQYLPTTFSRESGTSGFQHLCYCSRLAGPGCTGRYSRNTKNRNERRSGNPDAILPPSSQLRAAKSKSNNNYNHHAHRHSDYRRRGSHCKKF